MSQVVHGIREECTFLTKLLQSLIAEQYFMHPSMPYPLIDGMSIVLMETHCSNKTTWWLWYIIMHYRSIREKTEHENKELPEITLMHASFASLIFRIGPRHKTQRSSSLEQEPAYGVAAKFSKRFFCRRGKGRVFTTRSLRSRRRSKQIIKPEAVEPLTKLRSHSWKDYDGDAVPDPEMWLRKTSKS